MKRWMRIGIVLTGYGLAFMASVAFVAIYDRHFTAADTQTSGGMISGAEWIYVTGIFLLVALAPTSLALWFMRKSGQVWAWFRGFGLAFALLGLPAVLLTLIIKAGGTEAARRASRAARPASARRMAKARS